MISYAHESENIQRYNHELSSDIASKTQSRDVLEHQIQQDIANKQHIDISLDHMNSDNRKLVVAIQERHHQVADLEAKIKAQISDRNALDNTIADMSNHYDNVNASSQHLLHNLADNKVALDHAQHHNLVDHVNDTHLAHTVLHDHA